MKTKRIWMYIALGTVALAGGLFAYVYHWEYREPILEMHFFSLNRGRSIFIRTPENHTVLVGGGQNSEVIRELTRAMPFYSRKIDYVVVPSATPAQIGGFLEILDRYTVEEIIMPKQMATSTVLTQLMKSIRAKKIHIKEVERGDSIQIEPDIELEALFPYKEFKFNKTNIPELVLEVKYKKTKAFLFGNISKTIEKDLAKNGHIERGQNIAEFFNSMTESRTSSELLEALGAKFIFSTNEKTTFVVSRGEEWKKED